MFVLLTHDSLVRASASHFRISYQILFDNCHSNFKDVDIRQNLIIIKI
jgi:hypothetical protein